MSTLCGGIILRYDIAVESGKRSIHEILYEVVFIKKAFVNNIFQTNFQLKLSFKKSRIQNKAESNFSVKNFQIFYPINFFICFPKN